MKHRLKSAEIDARVVPDGYDQEIVAWLGDRYVRWYDDEVTVLDGEDREVCARPGWTFTRWPGGELMVSSRQASSLLFEPVPDELG